MDDGKTWPEVLRFEWFCGHDIEPLVGKWIESVESDSIREMRWIKDGTLHHPGTLVTNKPKHQDRPQLLAAPEAPVGSFQRWYVFQFETSSLTARNGAGRITG